MRRYFWLSFVILGGFLRLVWLAGYPAGFTPDEAAFGYNAYSLFKTGRDEWGTPFFRLPVAGLRSFGDYKLPLYAFLEVPVLTVFGLNEFSVRLPNALLASVSIALIYIFTRRLTRSREMSALAAFFLAVSPWSVPLSRGGFEANLTVFFLIFGLALLVSRKYLSSALIFALGMYSYHTGRLIIPPLFLASLFLIIPRSKRLRSALVFFCLSLPALFSLFTFNARSADISILNPDDGWAGMADTRLDLINSGWPSPAARLVSNKFTFAGITFIRNYFTYFSPRFLFLSGPAEATYGLLPGRGVLSVVEVILLPLGLYYFLRHRTPAVWLVFILFLLSPIPAALTKGPGFAANRAAPLLVPLILFSAAGAAVLWRRSRSRLLPVGLAVLFCLFTFNYYSSYLVKIPDISARSMGYGWKPATAPLWTANLNYSEIRVSRSLSESHIYLAFYSGLDPAYYQKSSSAWTDFQTRGFRFLDQMDGYWLANFRFGDLNFDRPVSFPVLYVGRPQDFPPGTPLEILSAFPDGEAALVMTEKSGMDILSFQL